MAAPFAISATLKDLETYASESGVAYTTLRDWIDKRAFPAVRIGHRYMVSPVHALQWFEARMDGGEEEGGKEPERIRRAGVDRRNGGTMEGHGLEPPPCRAKG